MRINLAREKLFTRDSTGKILTAAQLTSLTDGNATTSGVGVGAGEVLSVVCDLGSRYDLAEFRYYRTRATVDTITVEARQVNSGDWTTLTTTTSGTTLTSAAISGVDKYQYLRLTHRATTGSGTAREVEIYTDDSQVLYGSDEQGRLSSVHIDTGTDTLAPAAVLLYNPDYVAHDFYVLLDPSDTDSAHYAVASGISETYYPMFNTGISQPTTYAFTTGTLSGTRIVSNTVMKAINTSTSGVYFSPIMDLNGIEGRRFFWTSTLSGVNALDVGRQLDNLPTVDIRLSNTLPTLSGGAAWSSGLTSPDGNWSVVSGSIPWVPTPNYTILDPTYKRYFQARVEFRSTTSGSTPILTALGIERAFKVNVPALGSAPIYVKSTTTTNRKGSPTTLTSWYFEDRDIE